MLLPSQIVETQLVGSISDAPSEDSANLPLSDSFRIPQQE